MSSFISNPPLPRNYATELLNLRRGRGVYLWDGGGKRYLDLGAGIAVNALGYGRRDLARIAAKQMRRVVHVSNLYATEPGVALAGSLIELAGREVNQYAAVQFGNSGAEANEAALKYARLYAHRTRGVGHHKILSFENGFHGRTMGALSATPTKKYSEPFEPLVPGMECVAYGDVAALETTLNDSFAAVIVEVVQGEGGLRVMSEEFADALNTLCRKHDVMLIADEVQTGLGRTGHLFGSELAGLHPDLLTLSKPLGGGLPLSATLVPAKINDLLHPGDHGTTFGGGPVTTAVAGHVVATITGPGFMDQVRARAEQMTKTLDEIVAANDEAEERRGVGMLQGIAIAGEHATDRVADIMNRCREEGVLLLRSSSNVVRIAPPLVIGEHELETGLSVLKQTITQQP